MNGVEFQFNSKTIRTCRLCKKFEIISINNGNPIVVSTVLSGLEWAIPL